MLKTSSGSTMHTFTIMHTLGLRHGNSPSLHDVLLYGGARQRAQLNRRTTITSVYSLSFPL